MLKKLALGMVIALAAGLLVLVSYSYFTNGVSSRNRFILREGSGIFWEWGRAPKGSERKPDLGYLAPEFTLFALDGRAVALSDLEDRGAPMLLNFWASWCPPCRAEIPDLQDFHERYGGQVIVLGINWSEDPSQVRRFLERYDVTYTNVLDRQGKAFVAYRLTGTPSTFFLDEAGVIRGIWLGPITTETIVQTFARLTPAFDPANRR